MQRLNEKKLHRNGIRSSAYIEFQYGKYLLKCMVKEFTPVQPNNCVANVVTHDNMKALLCLAVD
jgi:hypothetical protein